MEYGERRAKKKGPYLVSSNSSRLQWVYPLLRPGTVGTSIGEVAGVGLSQL